MRKILISVLSVLFLGILFNCTSTIKQNIPIDTSKYHIQREWMLVSLGSFTKADLMKNEAKIDLTAKQEEGKIRGGAYMGCNRMSFTAEFKNNGKVKFLGLLSTMKACQNMELENEFRKKFETMIKYTVEGHFLTLSDDKGNVMKFVASDWD
ncbi:META domain-containing protein [Chryseobacterium camelliae]|uniref:META domain-containing protein n=1 Tax=Chryseobacterium camelliae TaxID=1265445 RepID=A0ABY7QIC9_9FLAO|nr:META domain-containing protein [Chryseobacterium camelliae]WBV59377.1 META domain-containing protein [Chryseobacterium camelliae]